MYHVPVCKSVRPLTLSTVRSYRDAVEVWAGYADSGDG